MAKRRERCKELDAENERLYSELFGSARRMTIYGERSGDGECFCFRDPRGKLIYPNQLMDTLNVEEGRMYRFEISAVPVDVATDDAEEK